MRPSQFTAAESLSENRLNAIFPECAHERVSDFAILAGHAATSLLLA
jgi:hypothetical protein